MVSFKISVNIYRYIIVIYKYIDLFYISDIIEFLIV